MIDSIKTDDITPATKLRSKTLNLSESEKKVATWMLDHLDQSLYLSMSEIAQICEVSDTTVLRMCRNAGFKGFTHLKMSLAQELANPTQLIHESIETDDQPMAIIKKVFAANIQALYDTIALLNEDVLKEVISILENARHILVAGVGGSAIIAQNVYQRLYRLGIQSDAPSDVQLQIMHSSLLKPDDAVIVVSYSGTTKDMGLVLMEAKRNGAKTILITGNAQSTIADQADVILVSVSHEIRSEPIAARLAQLALVDSIFILYSFLHLENTLNIENKIANSVASKSY